MIFRKLKISIILCFVIMISGSNTGVAFATGTDDVLVSVDDVEVTGASIDETEAAESETTENKSQHVTTIYIDNKNKYIGMEKTYQEGYVPTISNDRVIIILPILSHGDIKGNALKSTINLGNTNSMPFVYKNYEKDIVLQQHKVNDGEDIVDCYLIVYELDLKSDRVNGIYPVTISIRGEDPNKNIIDEEILTYVTISDGIDPNVESEPVEVEDAPSFVPKVMVESYQCSQSPVIAGNEVEVKITLVNTSQSSSVVNMTVTAEAPNEYLNLLNQTDTVYINRIGAGEKYTVDFKYKVAALTPAGQYDIGLMMDYADAEGGCHSSNGNAKINVEQSFRVEFDTVNISSELEVADVTEIYVSGMNLGKSKVYNVRANIEMDGLIPAGTIFIGDMEPGSMQSASIEASVTGLDGDSSYGTTQGTIIFIYEDENGKEYTVIQELSTKIVSPFTDIPDMEEKAKPVQWWIIMGIISLILICFGVTQIAGYIRRKKDEKM